MLIIAKRSDAIALLSVFAASSPYVPQMTLGQIIRSARKAKGLSQRALAALLGVNHSAVAHWELNDATPTLDNHVALQRVLGAQIPLLKSPSSPHARELIEDSDELALLHFWRSLCADQRVLMVRMLGFDRQDKQRNDSLG